MPHRTEPIATPHMIARARKLRHEASIPERILWGVLRKSRLDGSKFRRQQTLGPYIADFYCESAKLVVELDGVSHLGQKSLDDAREAYFRGRGLEVVRISNDELLKDREGVAGMILEAIRRRKPSPQPSPKGRGSSP